MADIKYLVGLDVDGNINLNTKELQFASIHPLAANPSSPAPSIGQTYWNTANDELRIYNGSVWVSVGQDTNYNQWQITDGSQTDDVTSDQVVKFAANATAGAAGAALTGSGTALDPYVITYTFPNDNTEYTAGTGLTLTGTQFDANTAAATTQTAQGLSSTSNRLYQVQTDAGDNLVVNVPWTDANDDTTYGLGVTAGGTNDADINLTGSDGTTDTVTISGTTKAIDVSETVGSPGTVTIDLADIIDGSRTFEGAVTMENDVFIEGTLDMNDGTIENLADPTNAQEAATKAYVDSLVSGGLTFKGTFNAQTGEILSGANTGSYLYNCPGGAGTRVAIAVGDYYVVATAGGQFYCSGDQLDIGDSIIAVSAAAADSSTASDWSIVQSDEGVVSLAAATDSDLLGINVDQSVGNVKVGLDIDGLSSIDEVTGGIPSGELVTLADDLELPVFNSSGAVFGLSVGAIGSGYTAGTYDFTTTTGTGSGLRATISVTGGSITGATVVNRGSGYTTSSTVSPIGAGGSMGYFIVSDIDGNEKITLSNIIEAKGASVLIGNGTATTFTIQNTGASAPNKNHGLGTDASEFIIQLVDVSDGSTVFSDVKRGASGAFTVEFNSAPASNGIRVLITRV
jgi:hypothetical protein